MLEKQGKWEDFKEVYGKEIKKWLERLILVGAVAGVASYGEIRSRHDYADTIRTQLEEEFQRNPGQLFPGYFEAKYQIEQDFFTNGGHLPWLEEVMQIPELSAIGGAVTQELIANPDQYEGAGSLFLLTVSTTHQQLHDQFPTSIPQNLEEALNNPTSYEIIMRYALITQAGIMNPFDEGLVEQLGLEDQNFDGYPWNERGYMSTYSNNGIFLSPEYWKGDEYNGIDRTLHMFHHALIMFLLEQSHSLGHHQHLEVPLPFFPWTFSEQANIEEFAKISGVAYEVIKTSPFSNTDGYFDPAVHHDFTANHLGREVGTYLSTPGAARIQLLAAALNSPALREVTEKPEIPEHIKLLIEEQWLQIYKREDFLPASAAAPASSTTRRAA